MPSLEAVIADFHPRAVRSNALARRLLARASPARREGTNLQSYEAFEMMLGVSDFLSPTGRNTSAVPGQVVPCSRLPCDCAPCEPRLQNGDAPEYAPTAQLHSAAKNPGDLWGLRPQSN